MSEKILDSNFRTHIQHLKSRTQYDINHPESGITSYSGNSQYYDDGLYPKLPTVEELAYGEIALNVAEGTETIAIKNNNGKIVFIPFNVAKRIQQLGQKVDNNYNSLKNYTDERISVLSGNTLTRFDSLQELLTALIGETQDKFNEVDETITSLSADTQDKFNTTNDRITNLSGKTANRFDKVEGDVAELSGYTQSEITELKGKIGEHDAVLNGLTEEIEAISQNVVEGTDNRLNELSAYTVSSFTQNAEEHEEIKASIASGLTSLSGQIVDGWNVVSGAVDSVAEDVKTVSGDVVSLSAYTISAITQSEAEHQRLEAKIDALSGNVEEGSDDFYNASEDIQALSAYTVSGFTKNEEEHARIEGKIVSVSGQITNNLNVVSGTADSALETAQNASQEITALSGYTVSGFTKNVEDHQRIVAEADGKLASVSGQIVTALEHVSNVADNALEVGQKAVQEIAGLSGYTVSGFTENETEHARIEGKIASVSGQIVNTVNIVSGTANNALEVAQTTSGKVEELSSQVDDAIGRIDGDIEDLNSKIDNTGSGLTKTVNAMNNSLGFTSGGTYEPTSDNLKFKNVTQSLDYIDKKLDEDILSGETRFINLMKIILEDEKVTANFAAIINHSCGFDINAQYVPATEFLKGLTVTEAIDLLYSEHIYKVESFFSDMDKAKLMASVTYDTLYKIAEMGCLVPGMLYRLTDYEAHVNTADPYASNVSVATIDSDHKFDIILTATSNRTLNENALAMYKPSDRRPSGDAFPESWEIKYTVYNDERTSWGKGDETDKGKGVIYYMKDFYGNEAPFDFKSIKVDGHFLFEDGSGREASGSGQYKGNIIRPTYTPNGQLKLNNIRFNNATNCYGNEFKSGCENITVEGVFTNNTVSPAKNDQTLSGKENTFLGFSYE